VDAQTAQLKLLGGATRKMPLGNDDASSTPSLEMSPEICFKKAQTITASPVDGEKG